VCKLSEGKDLVVREMPPFEFENWAVIALDGIPNKAQVGDMGIDDRIFRVWAVPKSGKKAGELDFMDHGYPIHVKQKDKAGRPDIDSFAATSAGFYESKALHGQNVPRVQLLTIAELLAGKQVDMPPAHHDQTLRKAPKAKAKGRHKETRLYNEPSD